jgi:RHH-type proline utilization regulon transcriptional repressor/proline dehydrogenase/delta 1-pyrroline-5-carboxylate dehydrogenase
MDWDASLQHLSSRALLDETEAVQGLLARTRGLVAQDIAVRRRAAGFIAHQREKGAGSAVEAFLQSYGLSTKEGIAMLCLAEALLRIPDSITADGLIEDTFASGNWKQHLGNSDSSLVNASTWALMLTGGVLKLDEKDSPLSWMNTLIKRSGEPVIRTSLRAAMKFLGGQFVMGEDIGDALKNAAGEGKKGYGFSYDILGEGARTDGQAKAYIAAYMDAIDRIADNEKETELYARAGISVKLSALHPRYSITQRARVMEELLPRLKQIIRRAMERNIAVSLDAEEANRLELQLEIYRALLTDPEFARFEGIGFVLQAYQKRAVFAAEALAVLAQSLNRRIPVRLVKGAYWDTEIKHAQVMGLDGYPVFTRKEYTDLSYLACATELLKAPLNIYPQFATHNALTAATIIGLAGDQPFEFQRLHGMGESLHDQLVGKYRVRIYAPVGAHKDLLAYLIRRLLENGANTSFVHLLLDQATPIDTLTQSPVALAEMLDAAPNGDIPLPRHLYGAERLNSYGIDFGYAAQRVPFLAAVEREFARYPAAPKNHTPAEVAAMAGHAQKAWKSWHRTSAQERAVILRRAADLMEQRHAMLIALCIREGKKTYSDAIAEIREAIDFLRYYSAQAETLFLPTTLPGPTGESNVLSLHGRGVFACISPWNFPLAIFTGQVAAALATGNAVIAKPAEQTPRIAAAAVALLHEAGVPKDVLQLAIGEGDIGAALVEVPLIAGVCFTGSTQVAKIINRALAAKDGAIVPLIAETGGLNAMIVDSSALLEVAVDDIITSAFGSAGQRCSALRAVFVQEDIAGALRELLEGAMDELKVGDPRQISTDIPAVIDEEAQKMLRAHCAAMNPLASFTHSINTPTDDTYVAPTVIGLKRIEEIGGEKFGPILHFFTYKAKELPRLLETIQATGYGLTFGLETRLRSTMEEVLEHTPIGNRYVNRSMIGAVVGVQPFGGEGLSGTGPKAGGPHYLLRFITERTTTINTAAIGGNVELLS